MGDRREPRFNGLINFLGWPDQYYELDLKQAHFDALLDMGNGNITGMEVDRIHFLLAGALETLSDMQEAAFNKEEFPVKEAKAKIEHLCRNICKALTGKEIIFVGETDAS